MIAPMSGQEAHLAMFRKRPARSAQRMENGRSAASACPLRRVVGGRYMPCMRARMRRPAASSLGFRLAAAVALCAASNAAYADEQTYPSPAAEAGPFIPKTSPR